MPRLTEMLNKEYRDLSPEQMLEAAWKRWGSHLGMTTAFGYSGLILLNHVRRLGIPLDIYFIDTGFHFQETFDYARDLEQRWGLRLRIIQCGKPIRDYAALTLGEEPWLENTNLCCHYHKVEPLLRALPEKKAWISALRRDQSPSRAHLRRVERDARGTLKLYPLVEKTAADLWQTIREEDLPYHPLYDQGYTSIGCQPCTRPTAEPGPAWRNFLALGKEGDPAGGAGSVGTGSAVGSGGTDSSGGEALAGWAERIGRWQNSGKLECGLHQH